MSDPTPRVRVTGPARSHTRRVRPSGRAEIDAESPLGELYLTSLMRDQLRLALRTVLLLGLTVGLLPLVFFLAPSLADVRIAGIPLAWLLLGAGVYPWLVWLGWRFLRRAEANEHSFAALVEEVER